MHRCQPSRRHPLARDLARGARAASDTTPWYRLRRLHMLWSGRGFRLAQDRESVDPLFVHCDYQSRWLLSWWRMRINGIQRPVSDMDTGEGACLCPYDDHGVAMRRKAGIELRLRLLCGWRWGHSRGSSKEPPDGDQGYDKDHGHENRRNFASAGHAAECKDDESDPVAGG